VTNDPAKSSIISALNWKAQGQWQDIEYHVAEGIAKITINRPEKRNAFRPQTVTELIKAFDIARDDNEVGVIILTGKGDLAFSSGGDQSIRGDDGYMGDDEVWGLVNSVVPLAELEKETVKWAKEMLQHSPLSLRLLKASFNAADDGLAGVQQLAGDATLLYYMSEEAQEGRDAYKEKRKPNFGKFPKRP